MLENIPKEFQKDVMQLREWYRKQPHLPVDFDDRILLRFLHSCYYKMEATKRTIECYFSLRSISPELIMNRDPLSIHMKKIMNIIQLAPFDLPENNKLFIWRLNDPGLENYDHTLDLKLCFMYLELWLLTDTQLQQGEIILLDIKDISLKFLAKFNLTASKKLIAFAEEALPLRLKGIHLVNCPSFIDTIFNLFKPLISQNELLDKIRFHQVNSDTLFKFIDKEYLPEELGGSNGTMSERTKNVVGDIMSMRHILMDDNFWKCSKKAKSVFNIDNGSFRSLEID